MGGASLSSLINSVPSLEQVISAVPRVIAQVWLVTTEHEVCDEIDSNSGVVQATKRISMVSLSQ